MIAMHTCMGVQISELREKKSHGLTDRRHSFGLRCLPVRLCKCPGRFPSRSHVWGRLKAVPGTLPTLPARHPQ